METVTFYSYKGGVGRSVAVNHIAERFAELNQVVFIIDFDLEAPGLHYKFRNEIKIAEKKQGVKKGLVDYLYCFFNENNRNKIPEPFSDYFYSIENENRHGKGLIYLMTAGNFENDNYWSKLSAINWKEDFLNNDRIGINLLIDLKGRIQKELSPDYLIIDSRTGISDIATLTLKVLADKVVVVAVNNEENLDGSVNILQSLALPDNQWNNKRKKLFFSLSRLPYSINSIEEQKEKDIIQKVKARFIKGFIKPADFIVLHEDRELNWGEKNINQLNGTLHLPIKEDYLKLLSAITRNSEHTDLIKKIHDNERSKGYFDDALNLFKKEKKLDEANAVLKKALKLYPNDSNLYSLSAHIFFEQNNLRESLNCLNKQISLDTNNSGAYNNRGLIYLNLKIFDKAVNDFTKAIEINPELAIAFFNRALVYRRNNDTKHKAIQDVTKAIDLDPNQISFYEFRAGVFTALENFKASLLDCKKMLELDPSYSNAYSLSSQALFLSRKYKLAFSNINTAIMLSPERHENYYFRGLINLDVAKYNLALNDFDKAIELKSTQPQVLFHKGEILFKLRKYSSAKDILDQYIAINKKSVEAYNLRGLVLIKLKNYSQALANFNKVINLDPKNFEAHYNAAKIYEIQNSPLLAIEKYSTAIRLYPKYFQSYSNRANVYNTLGKKKMAIKDYTKVLDLDPENHHAYYYRGNIYDDLNDYKNAILDFSAAIKIEETYDAYNNRAVTYLKLKKYSNAIQDAKNAIKIDKNNSYAYTTLAEINFAKKDMIFFYKYLRTALQKGFKISNHLDDIPYVNLKSDKKFLQLISIEKK